MLTIGVVAKSFGVNENTIRRIEAVDGRHQPHVGGEGRRGAPHGRLEDTAK